MRRSLLACLLTAALTALAPACDDGCVEQDVEVGAVCLPEQVLADGAALLEVREACGTGCAKEPECVARFQNGAVILELRQVRCAAVNPSVCLAQPCTKRVVGCDLPHLPAGDYPLIVPGSADRLLRVRPGGVAQCRLTAE